MDSLQQDASQTNISTNISPDENFNSETVHGVFNLQDVESRATENQNSLVIDSSELSDHALPIGDLLLRNSDAANKKIFITIEESENVNEVQITNKSLDSIKMNDTVQANQKQIAVIDFETKYGKNLQIHLKRLTSAKDQLRKIEESRIEVPMLITGIVSKTIESIESEIQAIKLSYEKKCAVRQQQKKESVGQQQEKESVGQQQEKESVGQQQEKESVGQQQEKESVGQQQGKVRVGQQQKKEREGVQWFTRYNHRNKSLQRILNSTSFHYCTVCKDFSPDLNAYLDHLHHAKHLITAKIVAPEPEESSANDVINILTKMNAERNPDVPIAYGQSKGKKENHMGEEFVEARLSFHCTLCKVTFESRELCKEHIRSEWHKKVFTDCFKAYSFAAKSLMKQRCRTLKSILKCHNISEMVDCDSYILKSRGTPNEGPNPNTQAQFKVDTKLKEEIKSEAFEDTSNVQYDQSVNTQSNHDNSTDVPPVAFTEIKEQATNTLIKEEAPPTYSQDLNNQCLMISNVLFPSQEHNPDLDRQANIDNRTGDEPVISTQCNEEAAATSSEISQLNNQYSVNDHCGNHSNVSSGPHENHPDLNMPTPVANSVTPIEQQVLDQFHLTNSEKYLGQGDPKHNLALNNTEHNCHSSTAKRSRDSSPDTEMSKRPRVSNVLEKPPSELSNIHHVDLEPPAGETLGKITDNQTEEEMALEGLELLLEAGF